MNTKRSFHKPVLVGEVLEHLQVKPGKKYIDATVGGGGHSLEILKLGGSILGIDCDPEAIKAARRRLSTACPTLKGTCSPSGASASWQLALGNFAHLKTIAEEHGFNQVDGVIFDLGVSSHQLDEPDRGFSFNQDGPLDMRMDPDLKVSAADLVNGLNSGELAELFFKLGDEHNSRRIAQAICLARQTQAIKTTAQLAEIITQVVHRSGKIHPATRCFQALRLAVNDELNNLRLALPMALELLTDNGRLAVISFHSGEDRIVKQYFKEAENNQQLKIITKKPVVPGPEEISDNPRARSAKMRVVQK